MRSLDEINRLLAEAEGKLAAINAHQAELLRQIAELQQERASLPHGQETPLPLGEPPLVTSQSPKKRKSPYSAACFGVAKMSTQRGLRV